MKKIVCWTMLILLLAGMLVLIIRIQPVKAQRTWTVDDDGPADFDTIQEAIDAASPGDTVFVFAGIYHEDVTVDKFNLTLIGQGMATTIIDGSGTAGDLITLRENYITIQQFTIRNSEWDGVWFAEGYGNNLLWYLNISNNDGCGIRLPNNNNHNRIYVSIVSYNTYGIMLSDSNNNIIFQNTLSNNTRNGIVLTSCDYNAIEKNTISNQTNWYGVIGGYCRYNAINYNNISNNDFGISLACSHENRIHYNNISANNWDGIQLLDGSEGNTVEWNVVRDTLEDDGIDLHGNSNSNIIRSNIIADNTGSGISLTSSSWNQIYNNELIENRQHGIFCSENSGYNTLYHNNFIDNTNNNIVSNAYVADESTNTWDIGYPSGGNYWSDYTGVDSNLDAIGDTPYEINPPNNIDNYPLMGMFSDFFTFPHYAQTICKSTISGFQFTGTAIIFNVSGEDGTAGFCRIRIPTALMTIPFRVFVDGIEIPYTLLPCSNSVYSYLYFTYVHSTHEIVINSIYALTITATAGGTTTPAPGTHHYTVNSLVQVTAIADANYLFDYWELDSVNVDSANPYTVTMDKNHTLKAVFSPIPPPLSASINPLSASILVGQSVTFTSTVSGGYTPYSYQWYLDDNPVSGAIANTWTFTPTTSGIYYVHLKVTDAKGNTAQSATARITVASVPVGGYSIPIQAPATAKPLTPYLILTAILTIAFTTIKRKTTKKTKKPP